MGGERLPGGGGYRNSTCPEPALRSRANAPALPPAGAPRPSGAQVYKLPASLDILGSPGSLVYSVGTGITDFFFEPAKGMTKSPDAFLKGVVRGTGSLLQHTVHGTCHSASQLSKTMAQGLAQLSWDKEWKEGRTAEQQETLQNPVEGLATGLFRGVTGLVAEPVKGVRTEGAKGLLTGLAKGLTGAVVQPATGIVDSVGSTFEGVAKYTKNTASHRRVREPRQFHLDRLLPYNKVGVVTTYENQRFVPGLGWGTRMLPTDRWVWSDRQGKAQLRRDQVPAPRHGGLFVADWEVFVCESTDAEGWQYAIDFAAAFHPHDLATDCVRRRMWQRKYIRVDGTQDELWQLVTRAGTTTSPPSSSSSFRGSRCHSRQSSKGSAAGEPAASSSSAPGSSGAKRLADAPGRPGGAGGGEGPAEAALTDTGDATSSSSQTTLDPEPDLSPSFGTIGSWSVRPSPTNGSQKGRHSRVASLQSTASSRGSRGSSPAASDTWLPVAPPPPAPLEDHGLGARAIAARAHTVCTWETQRCYPIVCWSKKLLPGDPWRWGSEDGKEERRKEAFALPNGWEWDGDWFYDTPDCDRKGWVYAPDIASRFHPEWRSKDCLRRRRWCRKMRLKGTRPAQPQKGQG